MSTLQMVHYLFLEGLWWGVFGVPQWIVLYRVWVARTMEMTMPALVFVALSCAGQWAVYWAQQPDVAALKASQTQAIDE